MRILAVSHEYPPLGGGGANAAYNLLRGFADRGCEVTLVTTGAHRVVDDKPGLKICEVQSKRSREESCSFGEMLDFLLKANIVADKLVKNAINDNTPYDIMLVFFGIPSGPIGYRLKKKYNIPYLIRFGGGDVPGFQKRFTKIYKILGPAIKVIWKNADARVANSEGLRKMALNYCDKYNFDVITNGVDTNIYKPSNNNLLQKTEDHINILFVSRLIERKGLQFIIPTLKQISEKTGKTIRMTIVGEGPYREKLEEITRMSEADSIVLFAGEKRGEELIEHYQQGDIFILPSSNEGMPNVVLEAMACGLPIIMTPCQGSEELVNENGVISEIDNFNMALIKLITDDDLREKCGAKSRERAQEYFSWNSVIDKYLDRMKKILWESE